MRSTTTSRSTARPSSLATWRVSRCRPRSAAGHADCHAEPFQWSTRTTDRAYPAGAAYPA
ncbi:hypothetical protein ACFQV2_21435 [Actinokineospora soli]|uniref:Uncharacterized protein n=1 Tax=Actinokineospora soli TaxID=1048753 RepID=A0ABW2TQ83_9PSEU